MANQSSITITVRKAYLLTSYVNYIANGTGNVSMNITTDKIINYKDFDDPLDAGIYGIINYAPQDTTREQYYTVQSRAGIKALIDA